MLTHAFFGTVRLTTGFHHLQVFHAAVLSVPSFLVFVPQKHISSFNIFCVFLRRWSTQKSLLQDLTQSLGKFINSTVYSNTVSTFTYT